jgi:Peptidase family M28/PDZ domain/PA domain
VRHQRRVGLVPPATALAVTTALGFGLGVASPALVHGAAARGSAAVATAATLVGPDLAKAKSPDQRLRESERYLADPALEGRGPGTAGIDSAATWLARQMKSMGLKPGGDEGYAQPFEVTIGVAVGDPCAVEVAGKKWSAGADMEPLGFSTNARLRAPVVFAGYGITAPGYDYDDYAGLDVRDKIVLVMTNEPGEMDSTSRFDGSVNTPHAALRTKAIVAREHGALGLLVVDGPRYHAGEPLKPPSTEGQAYMSGGILAARISAPVAEALLAPTGTTLAEAQDAIEAKQTPRSFALPESATVWVTLKRTKTTIANVVGWIPGRDTTRTLVMGAHYDHLGYGGENSLAPDQHVPHVGADDNGSGTAALLELERHFTARMKGGWRPEHNLVFTHFTGEEMGVVGSSHYVDDPTRPLESVETMLNMDMVGRMKDDKLMVMGVGTAAEFPALVIRANHARRDTFAIKTSEDGYGPSDHSSFYKRKVPVLMLFTGAHADYHKPSDTADKIDYPDLARVATFAAALIESLDARPKVTYEQAKADTVGRIAGGGGYGAYLGTIPDYMQTEGGVLLNGVRAGGPADKAGIAGGDVIVGFDGVKIDNIYDYTYALRSRKPGQQVRITIKRKGQEQELLVTLGRRP